MSINPPSSSDASLSGLPTELQQAVFGCLICDQETAERHPETWASQTLLDSGSLLNFCRASKRFHDIGLPILYQSVFIQHDKNLDSFSDALDKKPEQAAHVQHLYSRKWSSNTDGSLSSGNGLYSVTNRLMRVLQHPINPRCVALFMPDQELRALSHRICCLAAKKKWPSLRTLIFQSYGGSKKRDFPPQMVYIKLPDPVRKLTFCFRGPQNICIPPKLSFPYSLPRSLIRLNLFGISMTFMVIKNILEHCPELEQLRWDLNTQSWSEILPDNEHDSTCLGLGGQALKEFRLVNRDYDYELPQSFLEEEVLPMPLRCFQGLAKLEKLRVDLEGLARVTATEVCLPASLKELAVVVACESDFHRHWYQPDKDEHEGREGEKRSDLGEPRGTWLSLCFFKLEKAVSSDQLPNLQSLVVDHELDSESTELRAARMWKPYYEQYATIMGEHNITLSWTWSSEQGAPHS
ncbi:uncharacterized protein PG986_006730 [Apiospora aurea]|uniref:F-box domain-containing protein n=1 Tax=Apiospora aurea TaxID=335848 RepID=A0ABR1QAW7_9PEZI